MVPDEEAVGDHVAVTAGDAATLENGISILKGKAGNDTGMRVVEIEAADRAASRHRGREGAVFALDGEGSWNRNRGGRRIGSVGNQHHPAGTGSIDSRLNGSFGMRRGKAVVGIVPGRGDVLRGFDHLHHLGKGNPRSVVGIVGGQHHRVVARRRPGAGKRFHPVGDDDAIAEIQREERALPHDG